jgi:hypothetical protein
LCKIISWYIKMSHSVSVLALSIASVEGCGDQATERDRFDAQMRKRFFSCERRTSMMQHEYFDQLMQELLKQQQVWEQLKEENWQLRRQLANLRAAQGVVVAIEGKRFLLTREADDTSPTTEAVAVPAAPQISNRVETGVRLPRREETSKITQALQQTGQMAALRPRSAAQEEAPEPAHQEAKVTLQRELAGSFLLDQEA